MAPIINSDQLAMAREIVERGYPIREFFYDGKNKAWDDASITEKRECLIAYARYIRAVAQTLAGDTAVKATE